MTDPMIYDASDATTPVTELSKPARRVLGVLIEKAFTTPEYYPMTLKAVTTGCNQKNNRRPLTEYGEDDVADVLEKLREMGLAAVVHTESGRTERYRHYMRKRFTLSEPQLAILTELLLRGRQQLGELRSRASRMVPIETQDQLRAELEGLVKLNLLQASGPLDRRGVEVDHNLYPAKEGMKITQSAARDESDEPMTAVPPSPKPTPGHAPSAPAASSSSTAIEPRLAAMEATLGRLQRENAELREGMSAVRDELQKLSARFDELRQALGG